MKDSMNMYEQSATCITLYAKLIAGNLMPSPGIIFIMGVRTNTMSVYAMSTAKKEPKSVSGQPLVAVVFVCGVPPSVNQAMVDSPYGLTSALHLANGSASAADTIGAP